MNYQELQSTAQFLLAEYGRAATLIRLVQSGPDYDPVTIETEYPITVVQEDYSIANRDNSLVQSGDRIWLVSTAGEIPDQADKILDGGMEYQIVEVQGVMPGDTTLLFKVHGRR